VVKKIRLARHALSDGFDTNSIQQPLHVLRLSPARL